MDFNLLGGLMALLVPDGLMHPYITLTLHAFCLALPSSVCRLFHRLFTR